MPGRRQSNKDIRDLIAQLRVGGWQVDDPKGGRNIYKARCWCGRHLEYIHSTPSGPNYMKNKIGHMKKTCWKEV
jgi:hypothetical protein